MSDKYHALYSALIVVLISVVVAMATNSTELDEIERTLQAIHDCMGQSPVPWPDEWKQEYINTIREAIEHHQEDTHCAEQLEILRKGFALCWDTIPKTNDKNDKSLFEVYRCRMRWYVEHLMETEFPTEQERQKLRDQYKEIWDYAASSLLTQFPFLDPNAVQKAKADDLCICYSKIDAPLLPVYLRPMPEEQVGQIKKRWDNLRYARVDLWRGLSGNSTTAPPKNSTPPPNADCDYHLTKECLSQLLAQVWMVVPQRPDYYIEALENRTKELKRRVEVRQQARSNQQRLEKERSRQLLQTEHISFMLAALLETPLCLQEGPSVVRGHENPLERQDESKKGGGAYEIDDRSEEK